MSHSVLARNIKSLRTQKGWSQDELGERINHSRSQVSKWETEKLIPDTETIQKISDVFGVSVAYLMGQHTSEQSYINEFKRLYNLPENDTQLLDIVNFLQHAPSFKQQLHTYTTLSKQQQEYIEQIFQLLIKQQTDIKKK